jgi:hypothetical protein
MRKLRFALMVIALPAFLALSCNQPFSPKAPFEPQLVVYSILCNNCPQQFVRVYSTYDVAGYDPHVNAADGSIAGAIVTVTGPKGKYIFRDTLLPRPDTSRYKTPIYAYVADWRPEAGQTYKLTVDAGAIGSTQAVVTTPPLALSRSWRPFDYVTLLDYPDTASFVSTLLTTVSAVFQVSLSTRAISQQLYILYAVQNGDGHEEEKEVQLYGPNVFNLGNGGDTGVSFNRIYGSSVLHQLSKTYAGRKLTFKRIVFSVQQMEENWFEYYNIVRLSQDTHSTRFDQPDFTNLSHGYGVFGACTADSVIHEYPADFQFNH